MHFTRFLLTAVISTYSSVIFSQDSDDDNSVNQLISLQAGNNEYYNSESEIDSEVALIPEKQIISPSIYVFNAPDNLKKCLNAQLLSENNKLCKIFGAVSGFAGATSLTGTIPTIFYFAGDALHIPPGQGLSWGFTAWLFVTLTPSLTSQFYKVGVDSSHYILSKINSRPTDDLTYPLLHKKNKKHYAVKFFHFASSMVQSVVPVYLFHKAQVESRKNDIGNYKTYFYITAPAYYLYCLISNYKNGSNAIDNDFSRHLYDTPILSLRRKVLVKSLQLSLERAQHDQSYVTYAAQAIRRGNIVDALFQKLEDRDSDVNRHLDTVNTFELDNSEQAAILSNFKDAANVNYISENFSDYFLNWTSVILNGTAFFSRYVLTEYFCHQLATTLNISEESARILTPIVVFSDVLYRSYVTNVTQKTYFQSLKNCFTFGSFWGARKLAGCVSILNSALISLPSFITMLNKADQTDDPAFQQAIIMTASAALLCDIANADTTINRNYNELISKTTQLMSDKALVINYINKMIRLVPQLSNETLNHLKI